MAGALPPAEEKAKKDIIRTYKIIKAVAKVNTKLLFTRCYNSRMKVRTVRLIGHY